MHNHFLNLVLSHPSPFFLSPNFTIVAGCVVLLCVLTIKQVRCRPFTGSVERRSEVMQSKMVCWYMQWGSYSGISQWGSDVQRNHLLFPQEKVAHPLEYTPLYKNEQNERKTTQWRLLLSGASPGVPCTRPPSCNTLQHPTIYFNFQQLVLLIMPRKTLIVKSTCLVILPE